MTEAVTPAPGVLERTLFAAWRTNNRVTIYLIERVPAELWRAALPGSPRRTVGMMAAHLHNARSRWIRTLGSELGVTVPPQVERRRVTRRQLIPALRRSGEGILALLRLGSERGGTIPATSLYTWRNLPLDVGHVLTYFVAHEAHHRGQLVMAARALGARLPDEITEGLWAWNRRAVEAGGKR
jgi:uncharacterized damage-inducible protein DinB